MYNERQRKESDIMNYACVSKRVFSTKKDINEKKPMKEEAKIRREYIRNHSVSIIINPSTGEAEAKVTKR